MKKLFFILLTVALGWLPRGYSQVIFTASDEIACENSAIDVEITVENFTNVTSLSFPIFWDVDVMTYTGNTISLPAISGLNELNAATGELRFSWFDPTFPPPPPPALPGLTLPNNTVILTLHFQAVGTYTMNSMTPVELTGPSFPSQVFVEGNLTPAPSSFVDGSVTIEDTEVPQISNCPMDISTTVPAGGAPTAVSWTAPMASDNCIVASFTSTHNPGDMFPEGTTTVTYTATDGAGLMETCSFNVTVVEMPDPNSVSFVASDVSLSCDDSLFSVTVNVFNYDDPTAMQFGLAWDPAILEYQSTTLPGGFPPLPSFNDGFQANGELRYNWFDANPPLGDEVFAQGELLLTVDFKLLDLNIDSTTVEFASFSSPTFTIKVSDTGGQIPNNDIVFVDAIIRNYPDTMPVIQNCPTNMILDNDPGECGRTVNFALPTVTDDCDVPAPALVQTSALGEGSFFTVGTNTVSYTATDSKGQMASCSFDVTVVDVEPPVAICPTTIADVELDASGNGTLPANIGDGSSTDNCPTITETSPSLSFTCADLGVQTVTLTATDGSTNSSTVDCTFNVVDNLSPTAVCPAVIADVELDASGNGTLPADIGDDSSTDNCGPVTETSPSLSFTCADLGVQTVTLTATDGSTNSSTVDCTFNVVDNLSPTAVCPAVIADVELDASGNGTLPADIGDGSSMDNCPVTETSPSLSFTCADLGVQTVTLTATDGSTNSSTVDCTFNVVDNLSPTAVCPAVIADVELDASGNGTLPADIGDGSSTDNCGPVTETSPSLSFTCADLGVQTVTLTATDGSTNSSTVDCTFNVVDNLSPTAVCPAVIADVVLDGSGIGTLPANIGDGSSTDNCGPVTETSPSLTFACADLGVQTVTLTATDGSNNSSTVDCTFNVVETGAPIAICPATIADVELDASGNGTLPANIGDGSSTDNCGPVIETSPSLTFTCADLGVQTVTLTATDGNNNSSTVDCSFNVTDVTAPNAVCQDTTLYLGPLGVVAIAASLIDGGSTDVCGVTSLTTDPFILLCADVGVNSVTLNVADASGNMASCTAMVTVIDTVPPTTVCRNDSIYLDASGMAILAASDVDGGSFDSCGVATISVSQTDFDCSHIGDNTVTLTVTDVNGNVDSCMATVTVFDTIPPMPVCQNDTLYLDASGDATLMASDLEDGSTDNCGVDEVTASQTAFDCSNLGDNMVTVYVEDASDNVDSCMATVTVLDTIVPTLTCPSDATILVPPGTMDTVLSDFELVAFGDNCIIDSIHYVLTGATTGTGSGSVVVSQAFNLDTTLVTFYIVDVSGNVDSCDFNVMVEEAPITALNISCPSDVTQANDTDECSASVGGLGVIVTSGVASDTTYAFTGASGNGNIPDPTVFPVGNTTVTYTILNDTDTVSCSFEVMIQDTMSPSLTCPSPLFLDNDPGECGLTFSVGLVPAGASDNCPDVNVTTSPYTVGDFVPVGGPYDITATATDQSGNTTSCTYQLTVNDVESPVWSDCPADITDVPNDAGECGAVVIWDEPTAIDNCGLIVITPPTNPNGSLFPAGESTLVEYVAVDASGNSAKCSFTVTVVDVEPPSIAPCPGNITVSNDNGLCSAVVTWPNPLPADNCEVVSFVASGIPTANEFAVGGPYQIGYSATDEAGNTTVCTFTVTVEDNEFPQILGVPADITVMADPGQCNAVVNWTPPTTSDNCGIQSFGNSNNPGEVFNVTPAGQPHVINYTSTDINGNVTVEVFAITVIDSEAPVFDNCPTDDIVVNIDGTTSSPFVTSLIAVDCENVQVNFDDLVGSDNCGIASVLQTFGQPSGSVFTSGVNTLVFEVTDVNNNQAICSFNIIVEGLPDSGAEASPVNPCEGDAVDFSVLNVAPGASYTWKDPLGATVSTQATFTLPSIALAQSGEFTLEVAYDFCQVDDVVEVIVSENPVIDINYNDVLCGDGTVPLVLTGVNLGGANITQWQWTKPDGDLVSGQTLTINDPTIDDAGFYTLQATSDNGCVGTAQTPQEVIVSEEPPMPDLAINPQSAICLGESVFLNGEPFTGADIEYQWSADPLAGSGLPIPAPSNPVIEVSPTQPGTYTYFYTVVVDGCASQMAEVALQVEASPVVSIDVDGETTCLDGTTDITLSVNQASGGTITGYFWTPGNTMDPTHVISGATSADADVYSVTVTTDLGCTASTFINLMGLTDALTTPIITPDNDSICLGTNTTISSFPAYPSGTTYTWTVNGVVQPSSLPQIIVTPDVEGTTNVSLVVSLDGCDSEVSLTQVEALSMGTVSVSVDGAVDCLDGTSTVTLIASADGATSYEWIGQGVFDAELPIVGATSQDEGAYEVIARNDVGCVSQTTFVLNLTDALIPITAFLESPACEMQVLELCSEPTIPGATYEWTGPNGNVIATTQCPTIESATDILNGNYTVTAFLDGCTSTSEPLLVEVLMPPTANNEVVIGSVDQPQSFNVITNDILDGDYTISVIQEPEFGSVVYDGNGVFTYRPQAGFRETDRMAYEICYVDCPEACDIAMVTLLIRFPSEDCIATTVITPNNDGINDEFVLSCLEMDEFPQNTLNIYNEWGDEVFDAAPYDNTWRGTYNGKDLPDGTYFFIFRREPNVPALKGFVMIHR